MKDFVITGIPYPETDEDWANLKNGEPEMRVFPATEEGVAAMVDLIANTLLCDTQYVTVSGDALIKYDNGKITVVENDEIIIIEGHQWPLKYKYGILRSNSCGYQYCVK